MNRWEGIIVCVLPVDAESVSDGLTDKLTVLLQGVECILDRLVDSFLDGATHLLDLVDTATWLRAATQENRIIIYTQKGVWITIFDLTGMIRNMLLEPPKMLTITCNCSSHLIWIRNEDGGHVKATFVEPWSFAELLDNLHHHSLYHKNINKSGGVQMQELHFFSPNKQDFLPHGTNSTLFSFFQQS